MERTEEEILADIEDHFAELRLTVMALEAEMQARGAAIVQALVELDEGAGVVIGGTVGGAFMGMLACSGGLEPALVRVRDSVRDFVEAEPGTEVEIPFQLSAGEEA